MTLPKPEPGLVISYSYLWQDEARTGQESGRKDRPSVIVLAAERKDGAVVVTVLPVTHSPPSLTGEAIEIPAAVKAHLGMDGARSWIVVSEGNEFVWPGFDLRKTDRGRKYAYGFLPPRLFDQVRQAFVACARKGGKTTSRD